MFFGLARFTLVLSDQKVSFGGAPIAGGFPLPKNKQYRDLPNTNYSPGFRKSNT